MQESANDKRVSLITEVINLSDDEILDTRLVTVGEPDATIESHGTGHPPDPPPPPPGGGQ